MAAVHLALACQRASGSTISTDLCYRGSAYGNMREKYFTELLEQYSYNEYNRKDYLN